MNACAGLRGSAVGKVLVVEVWGPEFGFLTPGKKRGVVACACSPSVGVLRQEGAWDLLSKRCYWISEWWVHRKIPYQKDGAERSKRGCDLNLWPLHSWTHLHRNLRKHRKRGIEEGKNEKESSWFPPGLLQKQQGSELLWQINICLKNTFIKIIEFFK